MIAEQTTKRKIRAIIGVLCCCVLALACLSACALQTNTEVDAKLTPKLDGADTVTPGVLTVGINTSNSPYAGINANNETVGLDVDVAAAIAQELGLELQIVDVGSNGRAALSNNQIDVALDLTKSGTTEVVAYSEPYLYDGLSLFCLSTNKPVTIEDVAAQANAGTAKILVQADTVAATRVQELLGDDKIVALPTVQAAFDALNAGEELYLVTEAVLGDYFARNYENIIRMGFLGADCITPIYAVTLTQNSALSNGVNSALTTINTNGVMRVIATKWLGTDADTLILGGTDPATLPAQAFGIQKEGAAPEGENAEGGNNEGGNQASGSESNANDNNNDDNED